MFRLMAICLVLSLGAMGRAAVDAESAAPSLQQIVEKSAERFAEAYEQRDAAAIAMLFTDKAEYVDAQGIIFHGRDAIGSEFAAAFEARAPGTVSVEIISIRPVAEGVIVEDGVSSFTPEDGGPTSRTRYTATHVKQGDRTWLMASVRELDAGRMTPHGRLRALEWLIGQWHEDVGGNVIATKWKWSDDGNYLISEFSIRQSADVAWTGTHRIGWDAERQRFHSWIFESHGGTKEGWWQQNDDGSWSVRLGGAGADGVRRSSVLTFRSDGEDAIVVAQGQRIVGGESLPDSVHRVVRQPPAAEISAPPTRENK